MLDVDYLLIGHSMMIGAKGNQVVKGVCTSILEWCNVMYVNMEVEATNDTAIVVPNHGLLLDKFPFPTLPIPIHVTSFWDAYRQAVTIAIVFVFELARKLLNLSAAVCAIHFYFNVSSCLSGQSLPFDVALVPTAGHLNLRRVGVDFSGANRAGTFFFTAAIVTIVCAAMLVFVDVSVLLRRMLFTRNNLPTSASTINNFVIQDVSYHKSIIHA